MYIRKRRPIMKFMRQFSIILAISFLGEAIRIIVPLPIPASIYGLLIMLLALGTKTIKLHHIKETGSFLLDIMPLMFIPATVGLIDTWPMLQDILVPVIVISIASTIIVMAVTGRVTQGIIRWEKRRYNERNTK
jgi:holin-like protein